MGMSGIAEEIGKIFSKHENFDISGFAKTDLITPELAEKLVGITADEQKKLERLGYEFHWFEQTHEDGIISKWFKGKGPGAKYSLRIYFNLTYPNEKYPIDIKKGADSVEHGTGTVQA